MTELLAAELPNADQPSAEPLVATPLESQARPELFGRRVLVIGLGESGLAMAQWAAYCGASVTVLDSREDPPQRATLAQTVPQARFQAGPLEVSALDSADLVAWSQGLSPTQGVAADFHAQACARGIDIWGELDFFAVEIARLRAAGQACTVIAITGTNGKTTTNQWVCHHVEAG